MKSTLLVFALVISVGHLPARAQAAIQHYQLNIARQPLDVALRDFARQTGLQVARMGDLIDGSAMVGPVKGDLTADQALKSLLEPRGLSYKMVNGRTVAIVDGSFTAPVPSEEGASHKTTAAPLPDTQEDSKGNSLWSRFRVAQVDQRALVSQVKSSGSDSASPSAGENGVAPLEEIIVSAEKRNETIHDIPESISALSSEDISRRSLVGMGDFLNTLPGISMQDMGAGRNSIVIRGIGLSETDKDITGVYFGEVPLTSLAYFGSPDVKLVDMARVEVLRGPQGTLYGAGAMGGAVRNIPAPPDLHNLSGRVAAEQSFTAEFGGSNYNFTGVFNAPLIDGVLALRAVGYRFRDSGYYINRAADSSIAQVAEAFGASALAQNANNIGADEFTGGRISLLWQPTNEFKATATYMRQAISQDGFPEVQLSINEGNYTQARLQLTPFRFGQAYTMGGPEGLKDDLEVANIVMEYNFGWASLLSSSSYVHEYAARLLDNTAILSIPLSNLQANVPTGLFQELRLTSQLSGPVQFIAGLYYENLSRERDVANQYDGAPEFNPFGAVAVVDIAENVARTQKAIFGELTYHPIEKLAATVGARFFSYDVTDAIDQSGALTDPSDVVLHSHESKGNYKGGLTYTFNDKAMAYAQWAQGFRLGYPQQPVILAGCDKNGDGLIDGTNVSTGISEVKSDSLDSIELGGKFLLFEDRMSVNLAIYHADWKGLPVNTGFPCNAEVVLNIGEAISKGAELSVDWQLTRNLKGNLAASYTDARIARTTAGLGEAGQRLPETPRVNYSVGLEYDWKTADLPTFIASNLSYRGTFYNDLDQTPPATGGYFLIDAKAGLRFKSLEFSIFGKNLTNNNDLTYISQQFDDQRGYRLRPRTIGFQAAYNF